MKKVLIVGAGFSGATIARTLAEQGFQIKIIDCRPHLAGNAYDYLNEHGIRIHKYGPHLFHTSNMDVVSFLSRFTEWTQYKHKVKAQLSDGKLVTLPVNKETADIVGENNILDIFFRPYTRKMWGYELEDLDPSILLRVPVRNDLNEFYFPNDTFQALPVNGYTELVISMLQHPNISIELSTHFNAELLPEYNHTFNSMSIDEYFNKCYGELPYRSIKFHNYNIPVPNVLPVATVNFTHNEPYTRVTEWKNLPGHGVNASWTSLTIEEPCDFQDNNLERYYPVKDISGHNKDLYLKYKKLIPDNMTFIGRCGLYAYLDMHQAVSSALSISKEFINSN